MKRISFLLFISFSTICFGQNDLLNYDGSISVKAKQELFLSLLKESVSEVILDIEDNNLIYTTKHHLTKEYTSDNIRKVVIMSSFYQLLENISNVKTLLSELKEIEIKDVIFRTNTIYNYETKRYYFKFNLNEIERFPDFLDMEELYNYVLENNNINIIYVKNN